MNPKLLVVLAALGLAVLLLWPSGEQRVKEFYDKAETLYKNKDYEGAIEQYKAALEASDEWGVKTEVIDKDFNTLANYKIAVSYAKLAEVTGDITYYDNALEIIEDISQQATVPKHREGITYLWGHILYQTGRYELAEPKFKALIENFPDSRFVENVWYAIGRLNYKLQRFDKAREAFREILNNYPNSDYRGDAQQLIVQCLKEKDYAQATSTDYLTPEFAESEESNFLKKDIFAFIDYVRHGAFLVDIILKTHSIKLIDFKGKKYLTFKFENANVYNSQKLSKYDIGGRFFDEVVRKILTPLNKSIGGSELFYGYDIRVVGHKSFLDKDAEAEEIEYRFMIPESIVRKYKNKDITGQAVLDASIILMDDERIELELQYSLLDKLDIIKFLDEQEGPQNVVYCLDVSASMSEVGLDKLGLAIDALKDSLLMLKERDKFNIITFAQKAKSMSDEMLPANKENIKEVSEYLSRFTRKFVSQNLGTNLLDTILSAFRFDASAVILITDGIPVSYNSKQYYIETDSKKILQQVRANNTKGARIYVIGFGINSFSAHLLVSLAKQNNGKLKLISSDKLAKYATGYY